jgi:pimeloyl-ACP methyl ester carboxylesterase
MANRSPDGFDVVCHSMGGVLLRRLLVDHPDLAPHVRTVVTLGSPHAGTAAIRILPPIAELADLRPGSAWIAALPDAPSGWITVAGEDDAVVYPQHTAHLPQSRRVDLAGIGHLGLLVRQDVHAAVLAALSA